MGSNRTINNGSAPAEIFQGIKNELSIVKDENIFNLWKYYQDEKKVGRSPMAIVKKMHDYSFEFDEAINYFTIVGLEMFTKDFIEGVK
jgi:hypothetical protein